MLLNTAPCTGCPTADTYLAQNVKSQRGKPAINHPALHLALPHGHSLSPSRSRSRPLCPLSCHAVHMSLPCLASAPLRMQHGLFVGHAPSSLGQPGLPHERAWESLPAPALHFSNTLGAKPSYSSKMYSHHLMEGGGAGAPCTVGVSSERLSFWGTSVFMSVCWSPRSPSELEDFVEDLKKDSISPSRVVTLKDVEDGAFLLRQVGEAVATLKGELSRPRETCNMRFLRCLKICHITKDSCTPVPSIPRTPTWAGRYPRYLNDISEQGRLRSLSSWSLRFHGCCKV